MNERRTHVKMEKKGIQFSQEDVMNHIHDIAGLRIVTTFIDDVYYKPNEQSIGLSQMVE